MKKLRLLLCLLIVVCIIASSSITFSAMPQGKFPVQIFSSRGVPNSYEQELIKHLEKTFNNSPKYRVSYQEENRLQIRFLIIKYNPGVVSTDLLASSAPINTYSIVWLAKPQNKHAYFLWLDSGNFNTYEQLSRYILKQADTMIWTIKNQCPYVFD